MFRKKTQTAMKIMAVSSIRQLKNKLLSDEKHTFTIITNSVRS